MCGRGNTALGAWERRQKRGGASESTAGARSPVHPVERSECICGGEKEDAKKRILGA